MPVFRSSHWRRCSIKKGVLKNFPILTRKHLCQSLFFNKVGGSVWARCFPVNFAEFLKAHSKLSPAGMPPKTSGFQFNKNGTVVKFTSTQENYIQLQTIRMRNVQDTFETRKRSFISAFSICMTVPLSMYDILTDNRR